ncbi:MAG: type III-A CRISPR-associated RAMP protein Csm4 [Chloroflexota bacterium]
MQLECWNIQGAGFHFGRHGLGQEQTMTAMPSDSLFAALAARLARAKGRQAVDEFCQPFVEKEPPERIYPFVLSSTFPFAGQARFFPMPRRARGGEAQGVEAKRLKRVEFVSEGVFRALLTGISLAQLYDEKYTLQDGKLLANAGDFERLPDGFRAPGARVWALEQRPRVTLDRASSTSNLFHIGQVHFMEGCGLWFGVRWMNGNPQQKADFKAMLHELAAAGFGAERTTGLGIAEARESGTLDLPDATGAWVTLSRYLPREDETAALAHPGSAYAIKAVGGWLDSPRDMGQRRRPVNLIEAGSVIGSKPAREVPGRVEDVRPSYLTHPDPLGHPVYRCGLALAVGLQGGAA